MKNEENEENEKTLIRKNQVHEYDESVSAEIDRYFYDITFTLADHAHGVIITSDGVSIDWHGGSSTSTNITPNKIFPNRNKLNESELIYIMDLLEEINFEGYIYNPTEMENYYQKWKDLGCP
jgi:hypothetical protein